MAIESHNAKIIFLRFSNYSLKRLDLGKRARLKLEASF
jgi:hypothetical protein